MSTAKLIRILLVTVVAALLLWSPDTLAQAVGDTDALEPVADAASDAMADEAAGGVFRWVVLVAGLVVLGLFLALGRNAAKTVLYLGGMAFIFAGERMFYDDSMHWILTGLGLVAVIATLVQRGMGLNDERDPARKRAQKHALIYGAVGAGSLLVYFLVTDPVVEAMGFDEDAEARWYGGWMATFPIVWLLGTLPMVLLDRTLIHHPVVLPPKAANQAAQAGLATALALALVFPLNYLASEHKWEHDVAYFKTTEPGESTRALVATLPEPITAYLFFPAGNEVKEECYPYFEKLSEASGGLLEVEVVDQAMVPALAEELRIRENGYVALVRGDVSEKFKLGTDMDRARRELKKLDGTVQQHLLELSRGKRIAYVMVGHDEASAREKDNPLRKLNLFKKLLTAQNYEVKNFGTTEGSTIAVPDDASVVIVAAPMKPLSPEEEQTLIAYMVQGGRVFIMTDPGGDPMTTVLEHLGLKAGEHMLAHASTYIRQTGGLADRALLVTNRFGSHEAVSTLSKNSTQLAVVVPTVNAIEKTGDGAGKVTTLIRSFPDTWEDIEPDLQMGEGEDGKVHEIAVAVHSESESGFRAIVVGDVNLLSDPVLQFSQGNAVFAVDAMRWLVGDEDIAGEIESEEDVRIQHTREEDVMWFWGTIFGMPMLVLALGVVFVRVRRSK